YSPLSGFRVLGGNSKNSNPKFTRERQIFHYTFLFDAYVSNYDIIKHYLIVLGQKNTDPVFHRPRLVPLS
ncbi:hypothetical protein, partial [Enterocloster clostridioformis]|uniref:hypothetical protein n=1 Tax=Enterocloster clostridioformis TaxID=1531 RepID=UPI001A9A2CFF